MRIVVDLFYRIRCRATGVDVAEASAADRGPHIPGILECVGQDRAQRYIGRSRIPVDLLGLWLGLRRHVWGHGERLKTDFLFNNKNIRPNSDAQ